MKWCLDACRLIQELCKCNLVQFISEAKKQCDLPGLPTADIVTLGLMLCAALDAVHRSARCIHLDVKPTNILMHAGPCLPMDGGSSDCVLTAEPCIAKLADFGLAKRLPTCVQSSVMTGKNPSLVNGVAKGTAGYAPREQLRKQGQRRSDIYSLGATLLYASTGTEPYGGGAMESMYQLLEGVLHALIDKQCVAAPTSRHPFGANTLVRTRFK